MERSRASIVSAGETQSFALEVVKTDRFISLSSNMHNIETISILGIDVSAVAHKQLANVDVASETSEMDGREFIDRSLLVYPLRHFLRAQLFFGPS